MKTYLECLPCVLRQCLEGVRRATNDEALQEAVLRRASLACAEADLDDPSPALIGTIHREIRQIAGMYDPFRSVKETCNHNMLLLYPQMKAMVEQSLNPLETAVRLAIAGNIIDFVVDPDADRTDVLPVIDEAMRAPLDPGTLARFAVAIERASSILYLGDNAGEIVMDRLLIEQMPAEKVTFVVRGSPVVNDVTMEDAKAVGMTETVRVVENGSDLPGTVLNRCSESFRRLFRGADLIIAKGQGNYESLDGASKHLFFLFKAKCIVVELRLGCRIGDLIFAEHRRGRPYHPRSRA